MTPNNHTPFDDDDLPISSPLDELQDEHVETAQNDAEPVSSTPATTNTVQPRKPRRTRKIHIEEPIENGPIPIEMFREDTPKHVVEEPQEDEKPVEIEEEKPEPPQEKHISKNSMYAVSTIAAIFFLTSLIFGAYAIKTQRDSNTTPSSTPSLVTQTVTTTADPPPAVTVTTTDTTTETQAPETSTVTSTASAPSASTVTSTTTSTVSVPAAQPTNAPTSISPSS